MNAKEAALEITRYFSPEGRRDVEPNSIVAATIAEALAEKEAEIVRLITVICLCVKALYQAIEIAPLDRIPPMAGEAIQEAQATLDSLLPPDEKKEEPHGN